MITTEAWVLHSGFKTGPVTEPTDALIHCKHTFTDLRAGEALVEPILGAWEANIDHAITRSPIDVCSTRGDDTVILGNLGVVRVLQVHRDTTRPHVREGQICLLLPFGLLDRHGYAELVYAYDCPQTNGLLAQRTKIPAHLLLPIPENSTHSLEQWCTYGRYFTAWDNWHKAEAAWRIHVPNDDPSDHLVFAWGGGVSVGFLTLARRQGFRVAMTASSDERLDFLRRQGITPVDRREFPDLAVPRKGASQPGYAARHQTSLAAFQERIASLSNGHGAAIVLDNIGQPMYPATLAAIAREGVLSTCGWKAGMRMSHLRGAECINRHIHLHTHVWHYPSSAEIRDRVETDTWLPPQDSINTVDFADVGRLAADSIAGRLQPYFSLYRVNFE